MTDDTPQPRLTRNEQAAMIDQWKGFAASRAWAYYRRHGHCGELDDYVSAAFLGLVIAATRFDPTHGNGFSCYAGWYVMAELQKITQSECSMGVRIPGLTRSEVQRVSVQASTLVSADNPEFNVLDTIPDREQPRVWDDGPEF